MESTGLGPSTHAEISAPCVSVAPVDSDLSAAKHLQKDLSELLELNKTQT